MIRLSFIVPFYGVEKYIEECIRSLYDQDIPQEEYEVICVDDCSPDGSRAIVERLQKEYPTLRLLEHTENKRQGGARNTGLDAAEGRYIWYVDSDDYIKPNCLKGLLEQAEEENLDILHMYFNRVAERQMKMIDYGACTGSQYVFDAPIAETPAQRCCVVWRSIIKRDLLIQNNIRFAEHVQFEDDDYAYLMFAYAERVHLVPKAEYISRYREDSTMNSPYSLMKARYYAAQLARFITIEPRLKAKDMRWKNLIQDIIRWTCNDILLKGLQQLQEEDQKRFYQEGIGRIPNLWRKVSWRKWLLLLSYKYYKHEYVS